MLTKQLDQHRMSSLISAVPCLGYSDLLLVLLVVVDTLDVLAPEVLGSEFQTKVREDFTRPLFIIAVRSIGTGKPRPR